MMTLKNRWMSMAAAAALLAAPALGFAKDGADDVIPEAPKPQKPEKPGYVASNGADDVIPETPKPQKPEKPGLA